MNYGIRLSSGTIQNRTSNLDEAKTNGILISRWNVECDVVDVDTGEVLVHHDAYTNITK